MPRLGVLLVRAGALTEESVNRALAIQGFAGGRIGTLLIERGSASEDDVGKALAEQHGCEYIPWRQLGSVAANVTAALPAKFAIRHSAIPVELNDNFLRIVLRDPANLRILDELFFVTGKKIVPATAPEVRIYQALEKYYGERRTPRFAILAEKLSRPTVASVIKKPLPPPPDFSATPKAMPGDPIPSAEINPLEGNATPLWKLVPDEPPVGWGGLAASPEEVADEELESIQYEELPPQAPWQPDASDSRTRAAAASEASRLSARRPAPSSEPAPPPPPQKAGMPSPADFASILGARQRDDIFAAVLKVLARRFRRSAVLAVRPEAVVGWAGEGERVRAEALLALDIPWSEPSIFLNVRMSRSFYLGPLPPLPRHKELADALGGWPVECLVQPVLMREKTVAFLYVECASAQGATPADLTFVRELAGATAAALAAAIRLKKQRVI
jgi:MshEN domain